MKELSRNIIQRTLVLIKPDGVEKRLIGRIITRFEEAGLRIVGLGITKPSRTILEKHYPLTRSWVTNLGENTRKDLEELGLKNCLEIFKVKNTYQLGLKIRKWLIDFMMSGPIVKIALEGPRAIEVVRKIVGATIPTKASPGTVRGDFSCDTAALASLEKRAVKNLIHASSNDKEARDELSLWFSKNELLN